MKKFIFKTLVYLLITSAACSVIPFFLSASGMYERTVTGKDIYISIKKSKKHYKQRKLIIGDSVAEQLFPINEEDNSFVSLACNQAIGMPGHYFLLNNFISAGNQVDTVYLIYCPTSFRNNLDNVFVFHSFLKPFYTEEYKPYFTKTVYEQIEKIPYHSIARELHIHTSNWSPGYTCKDSMAYFLSSISIEYLNKMKLLAKENNFQLVVLPPPVSVEIKNYIENIDHSIIERNNLTSEFSRYFDNIVYTDDFCFIDQIHFKTKYLEQSVRTYREKLFPAIQLTQYANDTENKLSGS